jgi:hypothetical protein
MAARVEPDAGDVDDHAARRKASATRGSDVGCYTRLSKEDPMHAEASGRGGSSATGEVLRTDLYGVCRLRAFWECFGAVLSTAPIRLCVEYI